MTTKQTFSAERSLLLGVFNFPPAYKDVYAYKLSFLKCIFTVRRVHQETTLYEEDRSSAPYHGSVHGSVTARHDEPLI